MEHLASNLLKVKYFRRKLWESIKTLLSVVNFPRGSDARGVFSLSVREIYSLTENKIPVKTMFLY